MEKIALFNVGANDSNLCREPIFKDGTFMFIPIPGEDCNIRTGKPLTYRDLELEDYVPYGWEDESVHHDPNFSKMTYGHITRRGGYETILKRLKRGDILCFYATLDYYEESKPIYNWIDTNWGTYIIGAFIIKKVYSQTEFHLLPNGIKQEIREHEYLVVGNKNSPGLFNRAFPLHNKNNNQCGNKFLKKHFVTSTGKEAGMQVFYRHAYISEKKPEEIMETVLKFSLSSES